MLRSDFHFDLPSALIAQQPEDPRSASRLLQVEGAQLHDRRMTDFPALLGANDLLIFNNTRVIPARLHGHKLGTGGAVEVLIERLLGGQQALAQLRASKAPAAGVELSLAEGQMRALVLGREGDFFVLKFAGEDELLAQLERFGEVPLPPYIQRKADAHDQQRYQTVFAQNPGAVAAPTAGLHFDQALLQACRERDTQFGYVTLHVGAGTFQPMRVAQLEAHVMHAERVVVDAKLCAQISATRAKGGRVIAVGTTVVRSLEAAAAASDTGDIAPFQGETRLFITPGYQFRVVDALLTNFHLPESTLLMLVCAFAGYAPVMQAYRHAVQANYRFFSYGDAMWLQCQRQP